MEETSFQSGIATNERGEDTAAAPILSPGLTILVPTRNEAGNIEQLLKRIAGILGDIKAQILFVDDSTDNTPEVVIANANRFATLPVLLWHREPAERVGGLAGAVVAGMRRVDTPWVCVMDGDLQHPPELIPQAMARAAAESCDLVIVSRRVAHSEMAGLSPLRDGISRFLDLFARALFPRQLRGVSDPLTGFFLVSREKLDLGTFHPQGFKILLEILVRHPDLKKAEIPFRFAERFAGKSKASSREVLNYLSLLMRLRFGERIVHFSEFALVGASGILVNEAVLALFTEILSVPYLLSGIFATLGSTTWNFALTEGWVFHRRHTPAGRLKRYLYFFIMNNLALALRTPILYVLTNWLGVHYLISNLISLVLLTIARFWMADSWIWRGPEPEKNIP